MMTMTVLGCCFFVLGFFFWLFFLGGGGPQITYSKKEDKKRTKPFSFYDTCTQIFIYCLPAVEID